MLIVLFSYSNIQDDMMYSRCSYSLQVKDWRRLSAWRVAELEAQNLTVQRLLVQSLQPSLITPDMASCMACICEDLLSRLHRPESGPAVACLAQSQGLQDLLTLGRIATKELCVSVDVRFLFIVHSIANNKCQFTLCSFIFQNPLLLS